MQRLLTVLLFCCISCIALSQSPNTHQVAKGETLYSLSKKYHVTIEAIEKANKSKSGDLKLKIGQNIVIPAAAAPKTEVKPAPKASAAPPVTKPSAQNAATSAASDAHVHIVAKGETVYAIAKANGLTWKQIKEANHLSDDMKLKLGQKLIIPTKNPEAEYKPAPQEPQAVPKPVNATTEQGKEYLSATPAPVTKKEPAKQKDTEPAKQAESEAPVTPPAKAEHTKDTPPHDENPFAVPATAPKQGVSEVAKNERIDPDDYALVFAKYAESGKKKMIYRGICTFMQSENPGNQFLALYNYADIGSILKITNLISKTSIYVKVIGKVPATDAQSDVILKVSSEAAAKLKVSEDKFLVEVTGYSLQ